jgi:SAM-dependent methyltransferase
MSMWDERYSGAEYVYGTEPNEFLAAEYRHIPEGRVLCLAEGEGRNGVFLAQQGFDVTGVDASRVGLAKAQRLAAERHVTIRTEVCDLSAYDLGQGAWQGIVSIFAHLTPELRRAVLGRVAAALAPGGVFLLEAYTPAHRELGRAGGPPDITWLATLDTLQRELGPLETILGREVEREVNEGRQHFGPSHVVQLIARRSLD